MYESLLLFLEPKSKAAVKNAKKREARKAAKQQEDSGTPQRVQESHSGSSMLTSQSADADLDKKKRNLMKVSDSCYKTYYT